MADLWEDDEPICPIELAERAERAAYTIVARTLLNLDETITKE